MGPTGKASTAHFEQVRKRAESGSREAQYNLGRMYKTGYGTDPDDSEAAHWWFKAVRQGHVKAGQQLARLFRDGMGFEQEDPDAASWWFEYELKAAKQGIARAKYCVGRMYHEGRGVEQDLAKARLWYVLALAKNKKRGHPAAIGLLRIGAEQGDAEQQFRLAEHYRCGPSAERDPMKAAEWCCEAACQGHEEAERRLAQLFRAGLVFTQEDPDLASRLFGCALKAAKQGIAPAQSCVGRMYREGRGVEQDLAKAEEWYCRAEKQGHPDAAVALLCMRAEQGDAEQQFRLAEHYAMAEDHAKRDYIKAVKWYLKAAAQGHVEAQSWGGQRSRLEPIVAERFRKGMGFKQDDPDLASWWFEFELEALKHWWRPSAQCNVGRMYQEGRGVNRNLAKAAKWYYEAADVGEHYEAGQRLAQLFRDGMDFVPVDPDLDFFDFWEDEYGEDPDPTRWWFEYELEAAKQGSAPAQYYVGRMYHEGNGVEQDLAKGAEWYGRAKRKGHPDAAFALLRIGAAQGDAEQQFRLGEHCLQGADLGGYESYIAAKWWFKAVRHGHAKAGRRLAQLFREELSFDPVDPDADEMDIDDFWAIGTDVASWWFEYELEAAEQGSARAQYYVGGMYHEGLGVEQDLAKAAYWWGRAEKRGHPDAAVWLLRIGAEQGKAEQQFLLAEHSKNRNTVQALKWYLKAAAQGHVEAQSWGGERSWLEPQMVQFYRNFGWIFHKEDPDVAIWWFAWELKDAEQGSASAQCNVGRMYHEGRGVEQDLAKAEEWYCRAEQQGHPDAAVALLRMRTERGEAE